MPRFRKFITMDLYSRRMWIVLLVICLIRVGNHCNIYSFVAANIIVKNFNIRVCLNKNARTSGNFSNNISLWSKVISIIVHNIITINSYMMTTLLGKAGQIKDKNSTSIISSSIVIHIGIVRVFNFNTSYIKFSSTIFDYNVLRLTHIYPCIRGSNCNTTINKNVCRLNWV